MGFTTEHMNDMEADYKRKNELAEVAKAVKDALQPPTRPAEPFWGERHMRHLEAQRKARRQARFK